MRTVRKVDPRTLKGVTPSDAVCRILARMFTVIELKRLVETVVLCPTSPIVMRGIHLQETITGRSWDVALDTEPDFGEGDPRKHRRQLFGCALRELSDTISIVLVTSAEWWVLEWDPVGDRLLLTRDGIVSRVFGSAREALRDLSSWSIAPNRPEYRRLRFGSIGHVNGPLHGVALESPCL